MQNFIAAALASDNVVRVAVLRGIANSALFKAIFATRAHLRNELKNARKLPEHAALDERNEQDENARFADLFGDDNVRMAPEDRAQLMFRIHAELRDQIFGFSMSAFDAPQTLRNALQRMWQDTHKPDTGMLKEVAALAGVSVDEIQQFDGIARSNERAALERDIPQIIEMQTRAGNEDVTWSDLPPAEAYTLLVAGLSSLKRQIDNTLQRAVAYRRMTELADIPLLKAGLEQLMEIAREFEHENIEAIKYEIDSGMRIKTLDDL